MKIIEKIAANNRDNIKYPAQTIAFLGDSVTQGCFRTHNDYKSVYHNLLKKKLNFLFPNAVVNIINAGIGGTTAEFGAERIKRDVLSKSPDLCVVCFGLNDVGGLEERLCVYTDSLTKIFKLLKESCCEIIFMTPNMLNTYPSDIVPEQYKDYAKLTCKWQSDGLMDRYMAAAAETAQKNGVTVCDCYSKWKLLSENGVDTTMLLSNGINHPLRKMHELFANSLLETMFN